jgi:hypothetical protein
VSRKWVGVHVGDASPPAERLHTFVYALDGEWIVRVRMEQDPVLERRLPEVSLRLQGEEQLLRDPQQHTTRG